MSRTGQLWSQDQAAGLRRFFKPRNSLTVAFVSAMPGAGTTRLLAQTALHLAAQEQQVLLVDEHCGAAGASAALGTNYRFDLAQALTGALPVEQTLVPVVEHLKLLPAAKAVRALQKDEAAGRQELAARLGTTWRSQSFVLIDAGVAETGQPLSLLSRSAAQVVLVVGSGTTAVTASYLLLKRLAAAYPGLKLAVVVSKVRDEEEARGIYANLKSVASRHVGLELGFMGWVPMDGHWRGALVAMPQSGAAVQACSGLAQGLLNMAAPASGAAAKSTARTSATQLGGAPA